MYVVHSEEKVYLEVPEVSKITGLSKSQIYGISGEEVPSKRDPRNNSRILFDSEDIFQAKIELEEKGRVGEQNFRKWEEKDIEDCAIARSAINKMYRNNYDLKKLELEQFVHHKENIDMEKQKEKYRDEFLHVKDQCFGWANEDCNECVEHCNLFEACKQKRNEILSEIAQSIPLQGKKEVMEDLKENEKEDVEDLHEELSEEMEEIGKSV